MKLPLEFARAQAAQGFRPDSVRSSGAQFQRTNCKGLSRAPGPVWTLVVLTLVVRGVGWVGHSCPSLLAPALTLPDLRRRHPPHPTDKPTRDPREAAPPLCASW